MSNQERKVLIVGASRNIQVYHGEFTEAGFKVDHSADASNAERYFEVKGLPHIMVVDVELPDTTGIEFCQGLHDLSGLPIIIVSIDEAADDVTAVEALKYADDFLQAPFAPDELVMRARRILSRINNFSYASGPKIEINEWLVVDPVHRQINVRGETKKLTPIENALLHVLLKHKGNVVDADTLIERVWRADPSVSDRNVLRVHIHRLRQKLEGESSITPIIVTERGVGYAFVAA